MKNSSIRAAAAALALCAAGSLPSGTALAQSTPDDWKWHAIIYAYLPDIGGKTTFPAGTGSSINVDADTIMSNLKFTFMGTLEAQKGRWGGFTDVIYMDVGGSKSQSRDFSVGHVQIPAGVTADLDLDVKGLIWTFAGEYRFASAPDATFDVFAGARVASLKQNLGYNLSADVGPITGPGRSGSVEAKITNWDGIVGAKGRLAFGDRREWFVPLYIDVGTGDSDLTWQAIAGVGYAFSWGEVLAAWRYLDYNFKSGDKLESINFNGPAIGVGFHW